MIIDHWIAHGAMKPFKVGLLAFITCLLGFAGGFLFYAHTMARADVVTGVCVAMQEAVRYQMLTPQEVRQLGMISGTELKRSYGSVASKLRISDQSAMEASSDSVCSQYLVGVHASR